MRGLVLDEDETFVFLLALSVDGCDALVQDVDYVLSPGRLLTAMRSLPGKRMCRRPARGRRTRPRTGRGGTRRPRPRRGRGRPPPGLLGLAALVVGSIGRGAPVRPHRQRRLHDGATAVANVQRHLSHDVGGGRSPVGGLDGFQGVRSARRGEGGVDRNDHVAALSSAAAAATTSVRPFYFRTDLRYIRIFYVVKYYILWPYLSQRFPLGPIRP